MLRDYVIEAAIGFFLAACIVIAQYATTSASSTFIYQGF
jgi:hypothetical protein